MDREQLAQLLMQIAQRGNNPMGGPQPYANDLPSAPPGALQPEPGWMPPGAQYSPPVPRGDFYQPPPDTMQMMPIPRFHIPPGKQLNRREGASV